MSGLVPVSDVLGALCGWLASDVVTLVTLVTLEALFGSNKKRVLPFSSAGLGLGLGYS